MSTTRATSFTRLILRRLLAAIPVLFGMVTIVFFIARIIPGDPTAIYLDPSLPRNVTEAARHAFGLDRPLFSQYLIWLQHLLTWDFGVSFTTQRSVISTILDALPNSILLGGTVFVLQSVLGATAALLAVRHPGSRLDRTISASSTTLYVIPAFFLGTMFLAVFAYGLGWFPAAQMHSVEAYGYSAAESIADLLMHLFLPALTIALPGAGGFARYLRASLLDTLDRPFILNARSHGISESRILLRYAFPNAVIPAISLGGIEIGTLLTGTLVTEQLFSWPGMGRLTVLAVLQRDYPVLIGCTIVSGCVVILSNLLADIFHAAIDPRTRME
jgi:peptide/nickel transport system permease protein